jgi:hypothetical protein
LFCNYQSLHLIQDIRTSQMEIQGRWVPSLILEEIVKNADSHTTLILCHCTKDWNRMSRDTIKSKVLSELKSIFGSMDSSKMIHVRERECSIHDTDLCVGCFSELAIMLNSGSITPSAMNMLSERLFKRCHPFKDSDTQQINTLYVLYDFLQTCEMLNNETFKHYATYVIYKYVEFLGDSCNPKIKAVFQTKSSEVLVRTQKMPPELDYMFLKLIAKLYPSTIQSGKQGQKRKFEQI